MTMQTWGDVRSRSLNMATTVTVFTPETMGTTASAAEPGLLILLHGLTGNHAVWSMRTDLQSLADAHNLVIALPDGQRSFWIDQAFGLKWGTWVGEELPGLLRRTLRVNPTCADSLVGGLSMGGYGAFRAALDHPETFGAAISLSGTLDVAEKAFRSRHLDLYQIGFGDFDSPRPEDDLVTRVEQIGDTGGDRVRDLRFFACCGESDRLIKQNRRFREAADAASLRLDYREGPGGHDFAFWNQWLPVALAQVRTPSEE